MERTALNGRSPITKRPSRPDLEPLATNSSKALEPTEPACQAARTVWALLLARIHVVLPLLCPKCGGEMKTGEMKIIAFITVGTVIRQILGHLDEPTSPPRLMPARGPPLWNLPDAARDPLDPQAQPAPAYEFDQRIAW